MASIPVQIKRSSVAGKEPLSGDLLVGELAVNFPDKKLYTKDANGDIVSVGGGGITDSEFKLMFDSEIAKYDSDLWSKVDSDLQVLRNKDSDINEVLNKKQFIHAKATEAITKGELVQFAGAQGDNLLVKKARITDSDFKVEYLVGIATANVANNGFADFQSFGTVHNIPTNNYTLGQILYASNTPGVLSTTPGTKNIVVAAVTRVNANDGHILVRLQTVDRAQKVSFIDSEAKLPLSATAIEGDEAYVTSDGTDAGVVTQRWIRTATKWVLASGSPIVSSSVIDNTIKDPSLISEVGRYIVPDSDLVGDFVTQSKKYADWNGSTFTYTAPDSDDLVVITSGTNAGQTWRYAKGVWAQNTNTPGYSIYAYVASNAYKAGDLVLNNSVLYQANGNIAKNTVFSVGTSGSTWKQISTSGTLGSEYGEANLAVDTNLSATGDLISFTLPSAGVWEVTYVAVCNGTSSNQEDNAILDLSSSVGVAVANSQSRIYSYVTNVDVSTVSQTVRITTTAAESYKLRYSEVNANSTYLIYANGTKVLWKKISGFVPATGATTAILKATRTTGQSITAGANINVPVICNTIENQGGTGITYNSTTGTVTLVAGNTYRLRGAVGSILSTLVGNAGSGQWQWRNTTTGAFVGQPGTIIAPSANNTNTAGVVVAEAVITPSTTTTLQLWVVSLFNATAIGQTTNGSESGLPWIDVEQIGTTNTSGFTGVVQNSWNIANTYPSGSIVLKDDFFYQANALIPAGTAFTLGTTGATWKMVNQQAAEFGQVLSSAMLSTQSTSNASQTDVTGSSFTLPSAGTWEITYAVNAYNSAVGGFSYFALYDSSNVMVPDSLLQMSQTSGSALIGYETMSKTCRITTTGSKTVRLQFWTSSGGTVTINNGDNRGGITWKKISGFLPLQKKVLTETITFGAIAASNTINPVKATTKITDYITIIDDNTGWCELQMAYVHANPAGSNGGNGTYLFTLPAGYAFDTVVHPISTSIGALVSSADAQKMIPVVGMIQTDGTYSAFVTNHIVPHNATQFKICANSPNNFWFIQSGYYQINSGTNYTIKVSCRFKKA